MCGRAIRAFAGLGDWAVLPNGLLVSRSLDARERMICDLCRAQQLAATSDRKAE